MIVLWLYCAVFVPTLFVFGGPCLFSCQLVIGALFTDSSQLIEDLEEIATHAATAAFD